MCPGDKMRLPMLWIRGLALVYTLCLLRFLMAGGRPAIFFFTRPLRFLIGEAARRMSSIAARFTLAGPAEFL